MNQVELEWQKELDVLSIENIALSSGKVIATGLTFDGSFAIIEMTDKDWFVVAGPYLTPEEAQPDLRILQYENRNNI
jgi:hypothetical protein